MGGMWQAIVFSNEPRLVSSEREFIYSRANEQQDVQFYNNGVKVGGNDNSRPQATVLDAKQEQLRRPATAVLSGRA